VIADVSFDFSTHDERAPGSDNWAVTWADDDHQYTVWGDGGGFGGTNNDGRVSLGFGRIEGDWEDFKGVNIWGGKNAEHPAPFGGKSYGLLSVDGVLYSWWGPGSGTQSYSEARILRSEDKGATWIQSSWDWTEVDDRLVQPSILNFGKDYDGARDGYVYHYFIRKESTAESLGIHLGGEPPAGKIDLARVPKDRIMGRSEWEFFAGLGADGEPLWTRTPAHRRPVFEDRNGVGFSSSVSYNPGLGRYLLMTEHTEVISGLMGMFDAPEPWGPWTTVKYFESGYFGRGNIENSTFYWNFSNKWLSHDGIDFVLVFTGSRENDSWNTLRGSFTLRQDDSR
jgi:hypothetical protein